MAKRTRCYCFLSWSHSCSLQRREGIKAKEAPSEASQRDAVGAEKRPSDLRSPGTTGTARAARILDVKQIVTVTFLRAEVGGHLQIVMLKYERAKPGRVKAHG